MPFQPLVVIDHFDGGANSHDFAETLQLNESPNPRNIEFIGKTIGKAPGFTLFGTESETVAGKGFYNHKLPVDSDEVMVKQVGTTMKFYDETTDTHYPITTATLVAGERWWFASFNGYLYGGSPTNVFFRWKASAWGKLEGAITAGATTITLEAGQGSRFSASGSGLIEGDTFSWTGVSTDTLTGVTGLTSGHADGVRVITEANFTSYTALQKGRDGEFFKNRMFIIPDNAPNTIYFSKLADNTTPEDDLVNFTITGSGSGDAGFIIGPGNFKALQYYIASDNNTILTAFCDDGVVYNIAVSDSGGTTVGTCLPIKTVNASLSGVQMVTALENELIFMDDVNDMRSLGYSAETNSVLRTTRLSDKIEPTISEINFADGAMGYAKRKVFALGAQNSASVNNFALVKDTNPDAFTVYDHWAFNGIIKNKANFYGLSSITADVYKLFTGLNAGGDTLPISAQYPTPQLNFGAPLQYKLSKKIKISGFISTGCQLYFKVFLDGLSTVFATFLIEGDNGNVVDVSTGVSVGTVVFGTAVWGGNNPNGVELKRFNATLKLSTLRYFYTMQLLVINEQADVDFLLDKMMFWAEIQNADLEKIDRYVAQQ